MKYFQKKKNKLDYHLSKTIMIVIKKRKQKNSIDQRGGKCISKVIFHIVFFSISLPSSWKRKITIRAPFVKIVPRILLYTINITPRRLNVACFRRVFPISRINIHIYILIKFDSGERRVTSEKIFLPLPARKSRERGQ